MTKTEIATSLAEIIAEMETNDEISVGVREQAQRLLAEIMAD